MIDEWLVSVGVLLAGVGLSVVQHRRAHRLTGVDRELADLVDRDAVDILRAELRDRPVRISVHTETTLRGPFLVFDAGDRRFRMRLYGEACLPEDGRELTPRMPRGSTAFLVEIEDLLSKGWLMVLQTESGRRRYPGWQISQDLRRAPLVATRTT